MSKLTWKASEVIALARKAGFNKRQGKNGGALLFVKDEGIYLMPDIEYPKGRSASSEGDVLYAKGYGPECDYDKMVAAVGGDDFGETISTAELLTMASKLGILLSTPSSSKFIVNVSETTFTLTFER